MINRYMIDMKHKSASKINCSREVESFRFNFQIMFTESILFYMLQFLPMVKEVIMTPKPYIRGEKKKILRS